MTGCPICDACPHPDADDVEIVDTDAGHLTLRGTCDECGAVLEGTGRRAGPDDIDTSDTEWEYHDCPHTDAEIAAHHHADAPSVMGGASP